MGYTVDEMKTQYPLLWKKLDILCHGIKGEDTNRDESNVEIHDNKIFDPLIYRLYARQNPHVTERTGNNGLQIRLLSETKSIPLNVAVSKSFCNDSPYIVKTDQNGGLLLYNKEDGSITPIYCPDSAPSWYQEPISFLSDGKTNQNLTSQSEGNVVGDLVVLEGMNTAIASITDGCVYINNKEGCKFCAIGNENTGNSQRSKKLLKALSIMASDPQVKNFHLTGGNDYTHDRGVSRYLPFIEQIRRCRSDAKIAVEFTPPEPAFLEAVFMKLRDAGTDSITMNIEFWNDEKRLEYMPFKGKIPKEDYFAAFRAGLKIFGPNKVTCGFIVGLEDIKDTIEGIRKVTDAGVIAEVYPFKPNDGSVLANEGYAPTKTSIVMEASLAANEYMNEKGIHPDECSGCVKCGACGITQELHELSVHTNHTTNNYVGGYNNGKSTI